jgi:hypothetical protein
MKLICTNCQVEMKCSKVGVGVESMASFGPYQFYSADVIECPSCGFKLARTGNGTIAEHWQPSYPELLRRYGTAGIPVYRAWADLREKVQYEGGAS